MDAADFDEVSSALVDSYLLFLRGRGPEPDISGLSSDHRRRLRDQFAIVAALADRHCRPWKMIRLRSGWA